MSMGISESRFNMWRAVAAMIHADDIVKPHEINFILENTKKLSLSVEQMETLARDLREAGNIEDFYARISTPRDKEDFFHLARAIAWSDGEFDEREQAMLRRLKAIPGAFRDKAIYDKAASNFRDLYIEGDGSSEDPSVFSLIRGLLRAKKTA
jgi:uncharacterized tellurite resistance protein B-like protein